MQSIKLVRPARRLKKSVYRSVINHPWLFVTAYSTGQQQDFSPQADGALYEGHRQMSAFQRSLLAVGSAFVALNNPLRSDMVAALGETADFGTFRKLQLLMLNDETGCKILNEKPIIDSESVNINNLLKLPKNTFGYTYAKFMTDYNLTADSRPLVHYIDNTELAYIIKRYRQIHDFVHCLLGFSVSVPAEIVVKWFEFAHFGFPMNGLASVFGPLACNSEEKKKITQFIPWALYNGLHVKPMLNVYFENHLHDDVSELRYQLGITPPPYHPL